MILICLLIGKHPFTCFSTKELNKTERTQDARKNVLVISDVKRQNCFSWKNSEIPLEWKNG